MSNRTCVSLYAGSLRINDKKLDSQDFGEVGLKCRVCCNCASVQYFPHTNVSHKD